jgi:hypothetical protein
MENGYMGKRNAEVRLEGHSVVNLNPPLLKWHAAATAEAEAGRWLSRVLSEEEVERTVESVVREFHLREDDDESLLTSDLLSEHYSTDKSTSVSMIDRARGIVVSDAKGKRGVPLYRVVDNDREIFFSALVPDCGKIIRENGESFVRFFQVGFLHRVRAILNQQQSFMHCAQICRTLELYITNELAANVGSKEEATESELGRVKTQIAVASETCRQYQMRSWLYRLFSFRKIHQAAEDYFKLTLEEVSLDLTKRSLSEAIEIIPRLSSTGRNEAEAYVANAEQCNNLVVESESLIRKCEQEPDTFHVCRGWDVGHGLVKHLTARLYDGDVNGFVKTFIVHKIITGLDDFSSEYLKKLVMTTISPYFGKLDVEEELLENFAEDVLKRQLMITIEESGVLARVGPRAASVSTTNIAVCTLHRGESSRLAGLIRELDPNRKWVFKSSPDKSRIIFLQEIGGYRFEDLINVDDYAEDLSTLVDKGTANLVVSEPSEFFLPGILDEHKVETLFLLGCICGIISNNGVGVEVGGQRVADDDGGALLAMSRDRQVYKKIGARVRLKLNTKRGITEALARLKSDPAFMNGRFNKLRPALMTKMEYVLGNYKFAD